MASSVIYLCRHGETEWNLERRRQGQLDSSLTDAGRRQALRIASLIELEPVAHIVSSPLGRAATTAALIAGSTGLSQSADADLAEIHHGSFAGLTDPEIERRHPGQLAERAADKFRWRFPGGESYADAGVRAERALEAMGLHDGPVLAVAHQMIGRMLLRAALGLTPDEALERTLPHGTVIRIDVDRRHEQWTGEP